MKYHYYGCRNWEYHWHRIHTEKPPAGIFFARYFRYTREDLGLSKTDRFPRLNCPECGQEMGIDLLCRDSARWEREMAELEAYTKGEPVSCKIILFPDATARARILASA